MSEVDSENFEDVKRRLDEIVEAVSDEDLPLDDALKLYEEAVQLGLRASSLLEENLEESNARYDEEQGDEAQKELDDVSAAKRSADEQENTSSGDTSASEVASHPSNDTQAASAATSNLDGDSARAVEGN